MKKFYHAAIFLAVFLLLPLMNLAAQDVNQEDQLYFCWEETVKPEFFQEYLSLSKELIGLCKEENFPFPIYTWEAKNMVYQLWSPLNSLNDIETLGKAWDNIIEKWGDEKYGAFTGTLLSQFSKTATVTGELTYLYENPDGSPVANNFCRWIEIPLKPGSVQDFEQEVKKLNGQRKTAGVEEYVNFATGDLGFESPCYVVTYYSTGRNEFDNRLESFPDDYVKSYQAYLTQVRKLFRKPPEILDLYLVEDLVHVPAMVSE